MCQKTHTIESVSDSVTLCRKISFSSAHRYWRPEWPEEKNREVFGSLYSEHGHGHNYILEAWVRGKIDPVTGLVINLKDLDGILKEITDPLDHHHLNHDVDYFQEVVPTTENVARYCYEKLQEALAKTSVKLEKVRLYEGPDLWVDFGEESE